MSLRALETLLDEIGTNSITSVNQLYCDVLRECSDFDRTVRGAPYPHPTPQGRWVQFPEIRLQS